MIYYAIIVLYFHDASLYISTNVKYGCKVLYFIIINKDIRVYYFLYFI